MSAIGPELPPHLLAKRKRQAQEQEAGAAHEQPEKQRTEPDDEQNKRRRVVGPAPPPAPLSERPSTSPDSPSRHSPLPETHTPHSNSNSPDDDDDDDDDFGPSLPNPNQPHSSEAQNSAFHIDKSIDEQSTTPAKKQRDEWMIVPPKQEDLAARMDPTKLRARGFNTAKGAKAAPSSRGSDSAMWTETPEQKRKRLADEMMGVAPRASEGIPSGDSGSSSAGARRRAEDEDKASKVRQYNEEHRARSLMAQHQEGSAGRDWKKKQDDPSKRGFDYEKDMGAGGHIGHKDRREMLNKARGFTDKFAGGGYL